MEIQIAMAPAADRMLIYNAPNDLLGDTFLDLLYRMAKDNAADVISSSWGLCEPDNTLGVAKAEYLAFAQMAAQGQSFFGASGDAGAFDCLGDPAYPGLEVDDPPSQPYVTAVGGTSLGSFDPRSDETRQLSQGFGDRLEPAQRLLPHVERASIDRVLGVRGQWWRRQHLLAAAEVPARARRRLVVQPGRAVLQRGPEGPELPRDSGRVGKRRRIHAVRGDVHRRPHDTGRRRVVYAACSPTT